jgi:hypothetical protein
MSITQVKSFLGSLGTVVVIMIIAAFIIQLQCGRINSLNQKNKDLAAEKLNAEKYAAALEETLKVVGNYKHVPESIPVPVPYPVPTKPESIYVDSHGNHPFYCFNTKAEYDKWYKDKCTGSISGSDSTLWDKKKGARVDYNFYYGIGTDSLNWMLILPCGDWMPKPAKSGFVGGFDFVIKTGAVSLSPDITWRDWGPKIRIDIYANKNPEFWFGIRKSFKL